MSRPTYGLCLPILVALLLASVAGAGERAEVQRLAPAYDARPEVVAWDGSRVDLLNDRYAIEVDWASKWQQAVGQAMYYAILFDREPGIILLRRSAEDTRFIYRCQAVCVRIGIKLWVEDTKP